MMTSFLAAASIAFVAAALSGAALLPGHFASQDRVVEFSSAAPSATPHVAPAGAVEAARTHAVELGLVDCVAPAHARLDDVILTVSSDPTVGLAITPVGFDEALESGDLGRWNVLACQVMGE